MHDFPFYSEAPCLCSSVGISVSCFFMLTLVLWSLNYKNGDVFITDFLYVRGDYFFFMAVGDAASRW